jgi:diaminobutyrate-2-oxoglutarate transaminase
MIQGIQFANEATAGEVSKLCFERGLIIETAGAKDEVLKILPPLVMDDNSLRRGLEIVQESVRDVLSAASTGAVQ